MNEIDTRIVDGNLVEKALEAKGMQLCIERWEEIKAQALKDVLNEKVGGNSGLSIKDYQVKLYNQIKEWLDVPQVFIDQKEFAISEREKEVKQKEVAPFMEGRG